MLNIFKRNRNETAENQPNNKSKTATIVQSLAFLLLAFLIGAGAYLGGQWLYDRFTKDDNKSSINIKNEANNNDAKSQQQTPPNPEPSTTTVQGASNQNPNSAPANSTNQLPNTGPGEDLYYPPSNY